MAAEFVPSDAASGETPAIENAKRISTLLFFMSRFAFVLLMWKRHKIIVFHGIQSGKTRFLSLSKGRSLHAEVCL